MPAGKRIELFSARECVVCRALFRDPNPKHDHCARCWRLGQIKALLRTSLNGEEPYPKTMR